MNINIFLERHNPLNMTQEEIKYPNRSITREYICNQNQLPTQKSPGPDDVSADSTKYSKNTYFPQTLPKIEKNTCQIFL